MIRLFKRDECKYEPLHVHAEIISDGEIGTLKHKLHHNTYVSIEAFEKKMVRYAKWQAKDYDGRTGAITPYHTLVKPTARFLKHFVIQLGFLDGYVGFVIARSQAGAVSKRYKFLKEIRANREN